VSRTSRRRTVTLVVLVLLALTGVGVLLRTPTPHIELPAEKLVGPANLPGPFDFAITNTMIAAWITIILLVGLAWAGTRRMSLVPRGVQNLVEAIVEGGLSFVEGVAGKKNGRRFFPIVMTIFLFVLVDNWMGLLPFYNTVGVVRPGEGDRVYRQVDVAGAKIDVLMPGPQKEEQQPGKGEVRGTLMPFLRGATTDLNLPLALAVTSFLFIEYWGVSSRGFFRYAGHFFNVRRLLRGNLFLGFTDVFSGLLELISELARVISFTFRLFGNIFAGEVLIATMSFALPLVFPVLLFLGLELFVGFIQAFIFAMLTLVFGVLAVSTVHDEQAPAGHKPVPAEGG